MQKASNAWNWFRRQPRWRWVAAAALAGGAGLLLWSGGSKPAAKAALFAARRGPLEVTVLEGGSLQAAESQEIKCEVKVGYQGTKILKIVEEGYFVSEDDLKTNKVLVELDGSDLQKQIVQQEIQYQSAVASLIDAQQGYEIQLNQNQADIKDAEQKARFCRLDFDKFLGDTVTAPILQQVGLDKLLEAATTNDVEQTSRADELANQGPSPAGGRAAAGAGPSENPGPAQTAAPSAVICTTNTLVSAATNGPAAQRAESATPAPTRIASAGQAAGSNSLAEADTADAVFTNSVKVDFSPYANVDKLGDGEAKQKLRKFQDDLQVAQKDLEQAKTTVEGTRRLYEKGFVTQSEVQRDEITYENKRLAVQVADSARDLFLRYDFVKSAEDALSKYAQAVRELDKARRVAISKLAQAKAKLKSAEAQHEVQLRQRNELNEQLGKCTMRAKKSGLVVYGAAGDDMIYWGGEERIREGATVRERQTIITIPDLKQMVVKVKIHESYIKKIKKGQKAKITVDAFPDKVMAGEVTKVGVLPDSQNRWMNPDLKVYLTTITIDGTQDWVKPGMSAKVEIMVNKIDNCVYVPVQAISPEGDKQVCYLSHGAKPERREVEIGDFNDEFIEIKKGLREGDYVMLRPPIESGGPQTPDKEGKKPTEERKQTPSAPATLPASAPVTAKKA